MNTYSVFQHDLFVDNLLDLSELRRESNFDIDEKKFVSSVYLSPFDEDDFENPSQNKFKCESQQNSNESFCCHNASRSTEFCREESLDAINANEYVSLNSDKTFFQSYSEQKDFLYISKKNENTPQSLNLNEEPQSPRILQVLEFSNSCFNSVNQSPPRPYFSKINTENQKDKCFLNKKTKRDEILFPQSTLEADVDLKSSSSKPKKHRKRQKERIKASRATEEEPSKPMLSSFYSESEEFPLLNTEFLKKIVMQFYHQPNFNDIQEEKEQVETEEEKPQLVSDRMKFADSIYKKINIYFIRIPLIELTKCLIESNPAYKKTLKTANKKKLKLTDLSKDVTIEALKNLHNKTLREMFTIKYFTSESVVKIKKEETEETFQKRKENFLLKKEKKRIDCEKILSEITQLPIFEEIADVRINEIYNQIAENETMKETILEFLAMKYPDPHYLKMFEAIIKERQNTFELKGNESHQ